MLINLLLFAVGLALVVFSAHWLVDGASSMARRLRIPDIVIGLTIVAFGTSAPEMVVSVISALNGQSDVAIGNVIGSSIFNILGILGICAIIYPLTIQKNTIWKEVPLSLLAAIIALVVAYDSLFDGNSSNMITRGDGIILLSFFAIYMYYTFGVAKDTDMSDVKPSETQKTYAPWLATIMVIGGIAGLTFGGKITVENAVLMARNLGVSDSVIGLTLVAIGTSLPELATSVVATLKRNSDIALGNVIGSNIFNVFFILGVSSTISPLAPGGITVTDFLVCIGASVILFVSCFVLRPMRISRIEGWTMVLMYLGYTAWLIGKA
ncbi:MAG: calcium/sodium antiporter [Saprospiraceae bacterium]|nr:calcium/sodium antiporter [Saprospiraceae bacterium]MDZ4704320.1 calcium/sodium antiporter [Saprospiraceae bacterium]